MELKDFVAATLVQIVEGAETAQKQVVDIGATVNPAGVGLLPTGHHYITGHNSRNVQLIDFDIALTATEGGETGAHIGVFLGSVGVGAKAKIESGNSASNKVKFSIPIVLPTHEIR
jgi:hypothetical protein